MFVKQNIIQRKLRTLFIKLFNYIENNGNIHFDRNGEKMFTDNLFNIYSKANKGLTVFDVGANIGSYVQMVYNKAIATGVDVDIHAFEPTNACYNVLVSKFEDNKNIKICRKAVSNKVGTQDIFYDKEKSGLASLHKRNTSFLPIDINQSERVETTRLDNYVEENNIAHIHLLKIDIEGHELAAFEGAGKYLNAGFIDFIQFEYGGANLDSHTTLADFYQLLLPHGFKIAKIMRNGLQIRDYNAVMDNFIYANYVAVSSEIARQHNLTI